MKGKEILNKSVAFGKRALSSGGAQKFYSSLICLVSGLVLAFIVLLCISPSHAFREFGVFLSGGLRYYGTIGVWRIFAFGAPLICTGLAIAFAYKAGLFNIGVPGQYVMGSFGALSFALALKAPWYVCLLMAMVFGALWAAIPGLLKAYCGVNEVISGIMLNWVALYFVNHSYQTYLNGIVDQSKGAKTYALSNITNGNPSALIPNFGLEETLGHYFSISIFIAILAALIVYFSLEKTTMGYALKANGLSKRAARYAGMNEKGNTILSLSLSGSLAGLAAGLYYLSGLEEWPTLISTTLPETAWNGILVAFLGQLSPFGIVLSALLVSLLSQGARAMTQSIYPNEISELVLGIVVYLSGFSSIIIFFIKKHGILAQIKKRRLALASVSVAPTEGNASEGTEGRER